MSLMPLFDNEDLRPDVPESYLEDRLDARTPAHTFMYETTMGEPMVIHMDEEHLELRRGELAIDISNIDFDDPQLGTAELWTFSRLDLERCLGIFNYLNDQVRRYERIAARRARTDRASIQHEVDSGRNRGAK